jgi:phosphate transport system permease protein
MAALSRAAGEAAPLILIGAVTFVAFTPESLGDPFTALPVQIFQWATRPQDEFRGLAAATCLILLLGLLGMSGLAALLRGRVESGRVGRHTGE